MLAEKFYRKMYLIRKFENKIEEYFSRGLLRGTTHGYVGQEAIAVGVLEWVNLEVDFVTGNHRSHGHYIALTEDVFGLISELMGKATGIVHGRGGSQHLQFKNFYTNGITGGMIPVAVGLGLSKILKNEAGVVISFLGDGAMNEGYVMEGLNLSGVYTTPNIFILENNYYAMSTPTSIVTSGSFEERVKGFGIMYKKIKAIDVMQIYNTFGEIYNYVYKNRKPFFLEFETFRFCGHSKSDKREYVDKQLEDYWKYNDPVRTLRQKIPEVKVFEIESEIDKYIEDCFEQASNAPEPNYYLEVWGDNNVRSKTSTN